MADAPQAPQDPAHQTLVLTDPPPEEHHALLWSLCILAVALVSGGFVYAYWQVTAPVAEVPAGVRVQLMNIIDNTPSRFFREGNTIYCADRMVSEADAETFVALSVPSWHPGGPEYDWAKDKNHVYDCDRVIEEADAETFVVLDVDRAIAKDKNRVYGLNRSNSEFDVETLVSLGGGYLIDKNHIYHLARAVETADRASFRVLDSGRYGSYAKDKLHVYDYGAIIAGADPTTFQIINQFYAKDNNYVFSNGEVIKGADPGSFEVIESEMLWYSKDKNHVYIHGSVVPKLDPSSFVLLNQNYSKDVDTVWLTLLYDPAGEISDADPTTFQVVSGQSDYDAQDKNHKYYQGEIVE